MAGRKRPGAALLAMLSLGLGLTLAGCGSTFSRLANELQQNFTAHRILGDGIERYKAQDYTGAIPSFRRALEMDPTFDEAASYLAWSSYHLGEYTQATRQFRETIARQPTWEGLYDGLGWSRYQAGRYPLAIEAFQQALDLDPHYRDAAAGLAYSLYEQDKYQEALPHLERLTREGEPNGLQSAAPDLESVRSRLAWTLFYLGRYREARDQFQKGIAHQPEWYGLYNGLGWTYLKLGQRAPAWENFRRALQLKPDYADAKEGLAQIGQ